MLWFWHTDFTRTPQSLNVTVGSSVLFYCHNSASSRYVWYINGSLLSHLPYSQQATITVQSEFTGQGKVSHLHFIALHTFNNSLIVCEATLPEGQAFTNPAILLIQGS